MPRCHYKPAERFAEVLINTRLQIAMTVHIIRITELASLQRRLNSIARVFLLLPFFGKQINYFLAI
jgi:hypothetical protein